MAQPRVAPSGPTSREAAGSPDSITRKTDSATGKPADPVPVELVAEQPNHQAMEPSAAEQGSSEPTSLTQALREWLANQTDESGAHCTLREHVDLKQRMLLACGPAGLWVVGTADPGFELLDVRQLGGSVVGFFEEGGQLWVKVLRLSAEPIFRHDQTVMPADSTPRQLAASPRRRPKRTAKPPKERSSELEGDAPSGRVVELAKGEVTISLGSKDGLENGDRVQFSVESREAVHAGEQATRVEPVAVGEIVSVSRSFSRVKLGLNQWVPLGALAMPTSKPLNESLSSPPRVARVWMLQATLRPFIILEELGGGILGEASVGYRFEAPWHIEAVLDPLGFAGAKGADGLASVAGFISGSYDSRQFEVGFGFGGQTVNEPDFGTEPGSGILLVQSIRLGALDGLHLALRSYTVLFHSQFSFGGMTGSGQIPVREGTWLLFRGGGGMTGHAFGEVGLRVLLTGNGHRGSTFLRASVGGSALFQAGICVPTDFGVDCAPGRDFAGPMVGIGAEWRF